jgi:hypothetical protein
MENQPWVFCGREGQHTAHGTVCPGTGLCAQKDDHPPHLVVTGSLAPYWCTAIQTDRQPFKGEQEQRRRALTTRGTT